jgi:drug/metabolite transporter (DMT)-like permease
MSMSRRDLSDLLLLGAVWGASFLFMRMGAADFGPIALVFVRVAGASALLLPLLLLRGQGPALRQHWRRIAIVGLLNSALPFLLFTTAALVLGAALMSVFNATAPIWGALVAWAWLGEKPTRERLLGLAIGVAGVIGLAWGKADLKPGEHGISAAAGVAACILGTVLYGVAANYTRRFLAGVPSMAAAAGSQLSSTVFVLPLALWAWPETNPGVQPWLAALALAVLCTGVAYVLYFRLIGSAGSSTAISVTLLIPAFAMAWGWLFLGEQPTAGMLIGCGVILFGTALSTGLLRWPQPTAA